MSTITPESDSVTLICPNLACQRTVRAPNSARGTVVRCACCDTMFRVPENKSAATGGAGQNPPPRKR